MSAGGESKGSSGSGGGESKTWTQPYWRQDQLLAGDKSSKINYKKNKAANKWKRFSKVLVQRAK